MTEKKWKQISKILPVIVVFTLLAGIAILIGMDRVNNKKKEIREHVYNPSVSNKRCDNCHMGVSWLRAVTSPYLSDNVVKDALIMSGIKFR